MLLDKESTDQLIGLTLEEAKEKHSSIRVTMKDGVGLMKTNDHKPNRLNVHLKDGKIVSVYRG